LLPSLLSHHRHYRHLLSFPTRRSSDLGHETTRSPAPCRGARGTFPPAAPWFGCLRRRFWGGAEFPSSCCAACGCCFSFCSCRTRSEEHTSELQSRENLVCRLLLEKKQ